jgi:hypothetical protein
MRPPSDAAAALLANHGIVPGSLAAPVVPVVEQTPAATEAAPTPTPAPAAATPVATPVPAAATPAPVAEQPPPSTTAATGGAVAGQG